MTTYTSGHIKRNSNSGEVAIRTVYDESIPNIGNVGWVIAAPSAGARTANTLEVEEWEDLFIPEAVENA